MNDTTAKTGTNHVALHRRRHWLIKSIAGAAALMGFGLSWRTYQAAGPAQALETSFWELEFPTLSGQRLRFEALRGKPLLLNFWATWCPPCIEELPLLSSFYQEQSGKSWQVLGFAIDDADAVKRFLAQKPVTFPVIMGGASGLAMSRSLGNMNGALPFTVVINSTGHVVERKMGRVSSDELRAWSTKV